MCYSHDVYMLAVLKFNSNFFLTLVHAIHGHMTRYGWNLDWTLLWLAWNPDWTGMEPGLNSYGSIRVPCLFNQGSRPVQSGQGWWNRNQVKSSPKIAKKRRKINEQPFLGFWDVSTHFITPVYRWVVPGGCAPKSLYQLQVLKGIFRQ